MLRLGVKMHFRFRGNNIQVVRSQIDPKSGKAKSIPIGSINRAKLAVSEKLSANCSPDELKEIEAWVKRRHEIEKLKVKVAALTLPEQVASAIKWFETASPQEAREPAEEALAALAQLRRVLTKYELV
jgi:hypothetical protein